MQDNVIAPTPGLPYYAVIFSSLLRDNITGYQEMAVEMDQLARLQKGYLGAESARETIGITVSYWESLEAIQNWKANERHWIAQQAGRNDWYAGYKVRICRVERDYSWPDC